MIEESSHGQVLKSTFTRCPPYDLCRVGIVRPRFWRGTSEPAHDLRPTWGGQEPLGAPSAGKPGLLDRRPGYPIWYLPTSLRAPAQTHRLGRCRWSLCRPSGDSPAQGLGSDGTDQDRILANGSSDLGSMQHPPTVHHDQPSRLDRE